MQQNEYNSCHSVLLRGQNTSLFTHLIYLNIKQMLFKRKFVEFAARKVNGTSKQSSCGQNEREATLRFQEHFFCFSCVQYIDALNRDFNYLPTHLTKHNTAKLCIYFSGWNELNQSHSYTWLFWLTHIFIRNNQ